MWKELNPILLIIILLVDIAAHEMTTYFSNKEIFLQGFPAILNYKRRNVTSVLTLVIDRGQIVFDRGQIILIVGIYSVTKRLTLEGILFV